MNERDVDRHWDDLVKITGAHLPKSVAQIMNVVGCADVITETTRIARALGWTIVAVHGIWPDVRANGNKPKRSLRPDDELDDVLRVLSGYKNAHILKCREWAYSGKQYNLAAEYLESAKAPIEHLLWLEGDTVIHPLDLERMVLTAGFYAFKNEKELMPGGRYFVRPVSNQGFVSGPDCLRYRRKEGYDGHHHFAGACPRTTTSSAQLLHLHNFKRFSLCRVFNGAWHGAGTIVKKESWLPIDASDEYLGFLYQKYNQKKEGGGFDTYIGV